MVLINSSEAIKAISGIKKGKIILLFKVGKTSCLKFPLQFLSLKKSLFAHPISFRVEVSWILGCLIVELVKPVKSIFIFSNIR